ncbi:MAG: diguanylate cyclase domain-containing protein, partial [Sediminispirochaetaceae bacterium]
MDLLAVSVPLITTGLLLPVVLVYAYIYVKFPRRIYLSVLLLTLAGFFYVLFDFLTIHSSIIPAAEAAALQYNRIQELASSAFIPLLPFFLSAILQMSFAVRKINSAVLLLGIILFAVITLGAFIFPDSFLSVTTLRTGLTSVPAASLRGATGILFEVRDACLIFLVLYSFVLITVDLFLFRDYNYLFQLLIGFVLALALSSYHGLLAGFSFSRVGVSIAVFTLFGLSTYLRYFLNEAKIVHRAKGSLEEKERELQFMAYYDELTSLQNRKSFFINLGKRRPTEADSGRQRAICLIDLDTFGAIVDAYGQEISDFLLTLIARRLQELFHDRAALFRIGGDEFALTTDDFIETGGIEIIAKEILEAFQHPFEIGADHIFVSASVGIALSPENGEAPEELYKNAMRALSRAKVDRNTYAMYAPEMTLHASERLTLIHGLRERITSE